MLLLQFLQLARPSWLGFLRFLGTIGLIVRGSAQAGAGTTANSIALPGRHQRQNHLFLTNPI